MSVVRYNGIELSNTQTTQFLQEAVLTDDGTDYVCTHVFIEVHATINVNLLPNLGGETPSQVVDRIRGLLETPRRHLEYDDGDSAGPAVPLISVTGVDQPAAIGAVPDVRNGPFGKVFNLIQIGTGTTYLVIFGVECWIHECPGSTVVPLILAHRWEERQSIDDKFVSTYTRTGKIYASSKTPPQPTDRDARIATSVPLRTGFRRDSAEYILQADGLALMYTVKDVEVFRQAPPPAIRGDGHFTVTSPMGAILKSTCYVHLWGSPGGSQLDLIKTAITVVVAKLGIRALDLDGPRQAAQQNDGGFWGGINLGLIGAGLPLIGIPGVIGAGVVAGLGAGGGQGGVQQVITPVKPTALLLGASIRERLYDNEVEVTMEIQQEGPIKRDGAVDVMALSMERLDATPAYSPQQGDGPIPQIRGQDNSRSAETAQQLTLWAAILNDPCLQKSVLGRSTPSGQSTLTTTRPSFFRTFNLPNGRTNTLYSRSPNALYTDYDIRSYHRLRTFTEQLPTAAPRGNGQGIASIVVIADPANDLIIEWSAEASGDMPECPHWDLRDQNIFLVDRQVWPEAPELRADGTSMKYRISGRYIYVMADATKDVLMSGLFPWLNDSAGNLVVIPGGAFRQGIISTKVERFIPIAQAQG